VGHRAGLNVSERTKQIYSLFWDVTQRSYVVVYRRFETTHLSRLQGSSSRRRPLKMEQIGRLETPITTYQRCVNIPERRRSHLQRWKPEITKKEAAAPDGIITSNCPVRNRGSTLTTLPHLTPRYYDE